MVWCAVCVCWGCEKWPIQLEHDIYYLVPTAYEQIEMDEKKCDSMYIVMTCSSVLLNYKHTIEVALVASYFQNMFPANI